MNTRLFILSLALSITAHAADLPTISVEHLYYLESRAELVQKMRPEEMVEYCITQKIGGVAFENLYTQVFTTRFEITKLLKIEDILITDPRVVRLNKMRDAYTALLWEEARRVQNGIVKEGQVASAALRSIGNAQNQQTQAQR